jgi:hypothetical protein
MNINRADVNACVNYIYLCVSEFEPELKFAHVINKDNNNEFYEFMRKINISYLKQEDDDVILFSDLYTLFIKSFDESNELYHYLGYITFAFMQMGHELDLWKFIVPNQMTDMYVIEPYIRNISNISNQIVSNKSSYSDSDSSNSLDSAINSLALS